MPKKPNPWHEEIKLCAKAYQQKKKQKGLNVQITRRGKKRIVKVPKSAFDFKKDVKFEGAKFTAGSKKVQKQIIEDDKFNQMFKANINSEVMTEPKKRMAAVEAKEDADEWDMAEEEGKSVAELWKEQTDAIFKTIKLNEYNPPPPKQPFEEWQTEQWEKEAEESAVISVEDRKKQLGISI